MVFGRSVLLLLLWASVSFCQDTIRGTYSYTYGDKESLVEARQTCKDLAIREAIESYYIFVESSTNVENFQTKEDIIQSIAAGYLKDIRVVEQTEEGRTITMAVEATVMPEEVKQLVEKLVRSKEDEPILAGEDSSHVQETSVDKASSFLVALSEYEKRMNSAEALWGEKKFDGALDRMEKMQQFLDRYKPNQENHYQWLMYQSIRARSSLQQDLLRVEYFESQGKRIRARANMNLVLRRVDELRSHLTKLEQL